MNFTVALLAVGVPARDTTSLQHAGGHNAAASWRRRKLLARKNIRSAQSSHRLVMRP